MNIVTYKISIKAIYALSTKQCLSEAVHLTRTLSLFNSTLGIGNHFSYLGFNTVSLPSPWDGKEEEKKKKLIASLRNLISAAACN